jgi:coronin-7
LNFSSSGSGDDDIKATTEFSFEKVFSVPVAPGHEAVNGILPNRHGNSWHTMDSESNGINQSPSFIENDYLSKGEECSDKKFEKTVDIPISPCKDIVRLCEEEPKTGIGLQNEDASGRDSQPSSGSFEDSLPPSSPVSHRKPKTPSTAERRKLYEKRISSVANEQDPQFATDALKSDDADDKLEDFERASVQRSSIAERRRMYENRSSSVQDAGTADKRSPTSSPTPLRRQDSFKSSKTCAQEETASKRSPVAVQGQQSQEQLRSGKTQDRKPEPVTTPTPKRTSTVFGKSLCN